MGDNDANAVTIGDYFMRLAEAAWVEEEGFSGKRPFGNSGWQHEVYHALVTNKVITGEIDEYGYVEDYDGQAADQITKAILAFLRKIDWASAREYVEPTDWYPVLLGTDDNGFPVVKNHYKDGMTEKMAKVRVEEKNSLLDFPRWVAIRVPHES
jgi:hypothetical protein